MYASDYNSDRDACLDAYAEDREEEMDNYLNIENETDRYFQDQYQLFIDGLDKDYLMSDEIEVFTNYSRSCIENNNIFDPFDIYIKYDTIFVNSYSFRQKYIEEPFEEYNNQILDLNINEIFKVHIRDNMILFQDNTSCSICDFTSRYFKHFYQQPTTEQAKVEQDIQDKNSSVHIFHNYEICVFISYIPFYETQNMQNFLENKKIKDFTMLELMSMPHMGVFSGGGHYLDAMEHFSNNLSKL